MNNNNSSSNKETCIKTEETQQQSNTQRLRAVKLRKASCKCHGQQDQQRWNPRYKAHNQTHKQELDSHETKISIMYHDLLAEPPLSKMSNEQFNGKQRPSEMAYKLSMSTQSAPVENVKIFRKAHHHSVWPKQPLLSPAKHRS